MPPPRSRATTATARTARLLRAYLDRRHRRGPSLASLEALLDTAFLASLRTEESRPTVCTLAYAPPPHEPAADSEPAPPSTPCAFRFETPIPLTVRNLVKLAPAANPVTTTVLVHVAPKPRAGRRRKGAAEPTRVEPGPGGLIIWGLADQPTAEWRSAAAASDDATTRPGLFQIEITGVASLAVFDARTQIADLRHDTISSVFPDVLREGEIHDGLAPYFDFGSVPDGADPLAAELVPILRVEYSAAVVARILARMQRPDGGASGAGAGSHGGALLFARRTSGLSIKHALDCPRLREAVDGQLQATGAYMDAAYRVARDYMEPGREHLPMGLYHDQSLARLEAFDQAIAGAVGFVAGLTRVDGLVLIGPRFQVRGFGVEITAGPGAPDPPAESVVLADRAVVADDPHAGRAPARPASRPLDLADFGTRHRSMIRHCWRDPDAVGFVVSQDGEARAVRRLGDRVVVWDSIKVRAFEQQFALPAPTAAGSDDAPSSAPAPKPRRRPHKQGPGR